MPATYSINSLLNDLTKIDASTSAQDYAKTRASTPPPRPQFFQGRSNPGPRFPYYGAMFNPTAAAPSGVPGNVTSWNPYRSEFTGTGGWSRPAVGEFTGTGGYSGVAKEHNRQVGDYYAKASDPLSLTGTGGYQLSRNPKFSYLKQYAPNEISGLSDTGLNASYAASPRTGSGIFRNMTFGPPGFHGKSFTDMYNFAKNQTPEERAAWIKYNEDQGAAWVKRRNSGGFGISSILGMLPGAAMGALGGPAFSAGSGLLGLGSRR